MTTRSGRQRSVLGVPVTFQAAALALAVLAFTILVALAVLSWLESMA